MPLEIEHKFLLSSSAWRDAIVRSTPIEQGYLCADAHLTVRLRLAGDAAFLTIKGPSSLAPTGVSSRAEYEYPVPVAHARDMLASLAQGPVIRKVRHLVPASPSLSWEIDEFQGDNAGLILAEIELPSPDTPFPRPAWLGRDVTAEPRYRNSALARHPFNAWSPQERAAHAAP